MLTHVDQKNQPTMVDVSDKSVTTRIAVAESRVVLPKNAQELLKDKISSTSSGSELITKKGPVFQTAIIAGTMAVKKTSDLIPFCHPIAIESCKFDIGFNSDQSEILIRCEVKTTGKTGVEMEALTGSSIAALTIYDMCKALTHEIQITGTRLVSKVGGKRMVLDRPLSRPLYGLILTGGKSTRMKKDKALLTYAGKPQAMRTLELLTPYCAGVYLSAREGQWANTELAAYPTITDEIEEIGPIGGMLSAFNRHSDANWLIVACDLPFLNEEALKTLIREYDPQSIATCFLSVDLEYPEALFGIYSPTAHTVFREALDQDIRCPVKVLRQSNGKFLKPTTDVRLDNVNTPEEYRKVQI
jgi:cyclic pyranopterin monophosphate synthase